MSLLTVVIEAASVCAGWQQRRRAYGELMALDDHMLADVGLRRSDVPAITHECVRRERVVAGLGALQAKSVFEHRGLPPPIWPQI